MDLNEMRKYGALMDELKLTAFEVREGARTLRMERSGPAPSASAVSYIPEDTKEESTETSSPLSVEFKSPLVGVFYSASAEDKEDYVKAGSQFKKGDTLCIIEAMKLMNEIKAEEDGVIEKILVKNGDAVEFDTPLFVYRRAK